MKERPIMFSTPMVRALIAGAKTQTRRVLRNQGDASWGDISPALLKRCPYGVAGDQLWVRETHAQFGVGNRTGDAPLCVAYRATCDDDGGFDYVNNGDEVMHLKITKWTPAIFMPRWASRITLEVTSVRVQRLHDIDGHDVIAEGIDPRPHVCGCEVCRITYALCPASESSLVMAYRELWADINGAASWEANPWVWVIGFRRVP